MTIDVRLWPKCEVRTGSEMVSLSGQTGSARRTARMTRLTQSGNSSWRLVGQRDNREHSMTCFRERQTVVWSLPVLLLLSGCGGAEPECDSLDTRNSVVKIVSGDSNNALVNYAAKNSSVVEARVNKASTEAEKLTIWETARQGASYKLGEEISANSKSKDGRAVTCSGLLSATVEDATAHKQVDFMVEQTPDGNVSVSVSPFQF